MNAWSLFSGIGALDLGLERAGWSIALQCEQDAYCRAVLAERFPGVACAEDVRDVGVGEPARRADPGADDAGADGSRREGRSGEPARPDLVCGGFPCQDVSVAGRRAGLAAERSGLFFELARIIDAVRPRFALIENVPGLLTSNHGRDFATVVATLDGIGYVGAWRVLDTQFFGVPQRRRRVFVVAAPAEHDPRGDRCAEVLAVGARCGRHPRPGRTEGQDVAGTLTGNTLGSGYRLDDNAAAGNHVIPVVANTRGARHNPGRHEDTLVASPGSVVAFHANQDPITGPISPAMGADGSGPIGVLDGYDFRRLTPRECERLQGFPDDWTLVDFNGRPAPDSRRYQALGNAIAVPVAEWIGTRLAA